MPLVANKINEMDCIGSIVIWGAGRILDALVESGLGFHNICWIVDKYTPLNSVHGVPIHRPRMLREYEPVGIIIICSREYADEIKAEAKELCPNAEIIVWSELI